MIQEELYDVVDKNGKRIGEATWTTVHTKGLLHQVVHGLLFKDKTKKFILMKKRSMDMAQIPGGLEIAVGGHIRSGDNPEETIRREIAEELLGGRTPPSNMSIKRICKYFNNDLPNNHEIAHLFEIVYSGPFTKNEETEGKPFWVEFKELARDIVRIKSRYTQYSINAISEYLKKSKLEL